MKQIDKETHFGLINTRNKNVPVAVFYLTDFSQVHSKVLDEA
jgi:hypothetical protein